MSNCNINELVKKFKQAMECEYGLSGNTVVSYLSDLDHFMAYINTNIKKNFFDIKKFDVLKYVDYHKKNEFSNRSIARRISAIKQFYVFLYNEDLIKEDPLQNANFIKIKHNLLPKPLTEDEINKLLAHAKLDNTPVGIRINAILEIMYATGLRISEVISIKMENIKINQIYNELEPLSYPHILIMGKRSKERVAFLNNRSLDYLKDYLKIRKFFVIKGDNTNYLFVNSAHGTKKKRFSVQGYITRQYIYSVLKKLAFQIGIDHSRVSPHVIRHSFATHMLKKGATLPALQKLMGHQNIDSTQIYTALLSEQEAEKIDILHPLQSVDFTSKDT